MGISILSVTVFDGLVTINDLYGHVRDIRTTKENDIHTLECILRISKNDKTVKTEFIRTTADKPFLYSWGDAYAATKEWLVKNEIQYVDEI